MLGDEIAADMVLGTQELLRSRKQSRVFGEETDDIELVEMVIIINIVIMISRHLLIHTNQDRT